MRRFFLYTDRTEQYAEIKDHIDNLAIEYMEGMKLLEELR